MICIELDSWDYKIWECKQGSTTTLARQQTITAPVDNIQSNKAIKVLRGTVVQTNKTYVCSCHDCFWVCVRLCRIWSSSCHCQWPILYTSCGGREAIETQQSAPGSSCNCSTKIECRELCKGLIHKSNGPNTKKVKGNDHFGRFNNCSCGNCCRRETK